MKLLLKDGTSLEVDSITEENEKITIRLNKLSMKDTLSFFCGNPALEKITAGEKDYIGFTKWAEGCREEGEKTIIVLARDEQAGNEKVTKQLTDMQLAICEIFELIGGGNNG